MPNIFLDKYPRWDAGGPCCPLILQRMFMHAAKEGQKEAERFINWGHWHILPRPNPEVDVPAIQIVGYQTSQKEIQDLYHEVYLLRRLPSPAPCGPSQMKGASKTSCLPLGNVYRGKRALPCQRRAKEGLTAAALQPSHQRRSHSWS